MKKQNKNIVQSSTKSIDEKVNAKSKTSFNYIYMTYFFVIVLPFVLTYICGYFLAHFGPLPHHEGSILYPAYMVNHGMVPIKDVTIQHPPMVAYIYALGFKIFGEYFVVSRMLTLFCASTIMSLVSLVLFKVSKLPFFSVLSTLIYIFFSNFIHHWNMKPWSTLWALLILVIIVLYSFIWIKNQKRIFLIGLGTLLGFLTCTRLNIGAYAALSFGILLFSNAYSKNSKILSLPFFQQIFKDVLFYAVGYFVVFGSFVFYLYLQFGSFEPFQYFLDFQNNMLSSLKWISSFRTNNYALWTEDLGLCLNGFKFFILYIIVYVLVVFILTKHLNKWYIYSILIILGLLISNNYFKTQNQSIFGLFFDSGPSVILIALIDYFFFGKIIKVNFDLKYISIVCACLAGWGIMYPGGGTDVIYLAYGGLFVYILIAARIGYIVKNKSVGSFNTILASLLFCILIMNLFILAEARSKIQFIKNIPLINSKTSFEKGICIHETGFYKGTLASNCVNMLEYDFLKEYVDKNLLKDDKLIIWKGQSLNYIMLDRPSSVLPYVSLDIFVYKLKYGDKIDSNLVLQNEKNPPKIIIVDQYGMNNEDEVPNTYFIGTFPKLTNFIKKNYKDTIVTPYKQYLILKKTVIKE